MRIENKERNSAIELLKIIGIILIVMSHVAQTISYKNPYIPIYNYVIDLTHATSNIQHLILSMLRYGGAIGNTIFFACSAYFLLDSKKFNGKKWFAMLLEIWFISVVILVISYLFSGDTINKSFIIKSLFPTIFSNNWYMTCYLLFYPLHPILNKLIDNLEKKQLFRMTSVLIVLYLGIALIKDGLLFYNYLILWITIYFIMAYMKKYLSNVVNNKKINIIIFIVSSLVNLALILLINILGLKVDLLSNRLWQFAKNCNPFIIASVISLFNLVRNLNYKNVFINKVSSLTLLVYLLHENIIFRTYYRPYMVNYIYENYGYKYILLETILLSLVIYVVSLIISYIYDVTLRKVVNRFSFMICDICSKIWNKFEEIAMKIE